MDIHDKLTATLKAQAVSADAPPEDKTLRVMMFEGKRPLLVPLEALREMFAPEPLPLEPVLSEPVDLTPITEQLNSHDAQLKSVRQRVRIIEVGLSPSSPAPEPTPKRGVFGVDPDFKAPNGELGKRYAAARAWLVRYEAVAIGPMLEGRMAYSGRNGTPNPGGVVHIKDFRFVQTYVQALLALLHVHGDPWAARELARVVVGLLARTTDRYGERAVSKVEEQVGLRRWLMFPIEQFTEQTHSQFTHTDLMWLEGDLTAGTLAEMLRGLSDNRAIRECGVAYTALLTFYEQDWRPRRHRLSKLQRPTKPEYLYGSGLTHPSLSRYMEYALMFSMFGRAEDKAASEAYALWLAADHHLVTAPDGQQVLTFPQGVQDRYREMFGKPDNGVAAFAVYLRESFPRYEIGLWCGLPLFTPALAEAVVGTCDWVLNAPNGPGNEPYSRDIGGGPARTSDLKVVQFRDGSSVKGKWPIVAANIVGQRSHSLSSGLSHISAYRTGSARLEAEMQGILERHGGAGHAGIAVPLLLIEAHREGLI